MNIDHISTAGPPCDNSAQSTHSIMRISVCICVRTFLCCAVLGVVLSQFYEKAQVFFQVAIILIAIAPICVLLSILADSLKVRSWLGVVAVVVLFVTGAVLVLLSV